MAKFELISEIARTPSDIFPSIHEIYYKHFSAFPFFVFHTGITDRYHEAVYDEDEDDDGESHSIPSLGIELLNKEYGEFTKYVKERWSEANLTVLENPTVYKYLNHEANLFMMFIVLLNNTIIQIRVSPSRRKTMTAFTIYSQHGQEPGIDLLTEYAKRFIAPPPSKKDKIHIITQSGNDFYLRDIILKNSKRSKFSYDHYNEGFEEISNRVITTLQNDNESGLVLFHGDAGTGKTSYLKHLLHTISNKKLIYMPPDLTEHLSSPGFVTFMMGEAINSILLIEDAENVLRHREAGGSQAVSNILNISDGILGDVLKLQIVCTFNSSLDVIDPALRRPGRCIAEYRFEKLTEERAGNLMAKLHGEDVVWEPKEMTLAEVFNFKKPHDVTKDKGSSFGFVPLETKKKK